MTAWDSAPLAMEVNKMHPVDEHCTNAEVLDAAKSRGYVEFPWSDLGMGEVHQVRQVCVRRADNTLLDVWVFDLHPMYSLIERPVVDYPIRNSEPPVDQESTTRLGGGKLMRYFSALFRLAN